MDRAHEPNIHDAPLDVQVIDGDVVLLCSPIGTTSLTRGAAIETGVRLVTAGMGIDEGPR